ncbi:hypothetical protein V6Z11_A08G042300 [Gossypium hirsutum]
MQTHARFHLACCRRVPIILMADNAQTVARSYERRPQLSRSSTEVRGQLWRYVALDVGAYGGARGSRTVLRARGCGAGLGETLGFLLRQRKERKKLTKSDSGNYG